MKLTDTQIRILGKLEAGYTIRELVDEFDIPQSTIAELRRDYQKLADKDSIDSIIMRDKVETEKAKHMVVHDVECESEDIKHDILAPNYDSDENILDTSCRATALKILNAAKEVACSSGITAYELEQCANVVVKLHSLTMPAGGASMQASTPSFLGELKD